jgi:phosphatidylinositol alpha-1,6-mannosyltransferase
MRTLVVTNDFPPRRGGIERLVRSLCDGDTVVYTASMPGDQEYDAQQPFTIHRDPSTILLPTPRVAREVRRVMREEGCERVVFGASAPLGLLARSLRRSGALQLTAITHGHEVWWARLPGTRQLLRRIGEDVDELTYVSEWCRDRIARALAPASRTKLVPLVPTVDRELFRPGGGAAVRQRLGITADAPVAVCVARMIRRKGQDTLVRIWPEVQARHPGAVLLLVGDGPDRARIERMVRRRRLHGVVFAGSVDPADVPSYLDAGDVFAMPCRTRRLGLEAEAFGIVYLEAAVMGLQVVGGRSGGAPEAVRLAAQLQPPRGPREPPKR